MKEKLSKIWEWIKTHKFWVGVLGVVLLVSLFTVPKRVVSYYKGPTEKHETAKVKKQDLIKTISASGEISAESQVVLKFQASGRLAWIGVKEGDRVEKWQALASLDKRELEKTIRKELNDYMNERWDFQQTREDYDVSSDDLDRYTLENAVRRILDKAQFDLNNVVLDVEIADLAIQLATIVSPIEGIVTAVESPIAGVNVTPATAEITVANPGQMKFVANVDEADISQITIGQKVLITLDAYLEETFEGQVGKIAFAAITTKGGGTAFPIEIMLPENFEEKLKVGMNGDAEVVLESREQTLIIPTEAISKKDGQPFARVIDGREIKEVEVELGVENDTKVEVLSGLEEGQIVITGEKEED